MHTHYTHTPTIDTHTFRYIHTFSWTQTHITRKKHMNAHTHIHPWTQSAIGAHTFLARAAESREAFRNQNAVVKSFRFFSPQGGAGYGDCGSHDVADHQEPSNHHRSSV